MTVRSTHGAAGGGISRQHEDTRTVLLRFVGTAGDGHQRRLAQQVLTYLEQHPDATTRGCRPDHVTASAVVLAPDGRRAMLNLHAKARRWLQFGGHLEPGDVGLADAALREAREESGCPDLRLWSAVPVAVDIHPAPCGARRHLDVQFAAVAPADAQPVPSAESDDVAWFPVDALPADADGSVRRLVAQAVERVLAGESPATETTSPGGSSASTPRAPSGAPTPSS